MALAISLDLRLEQLDELGPFGSRAHEAHLTLEHVEELRQFVERRGAQDFADLGPTVDAFHATGGGTGFQLEGGIGGVGCSHRPELQAVEDPAVASHAWLAEEDRSR